MTLTQLARFMKDEGAIKAVNLDGGGSATMWTRGKGVVNRPSDGAQRPVTNALLLLPHADPGEPSHLRSLHPTAVQPEAVPASPEEAAQAWASAQTDPGSTGGLLYALSTGQLGNGGGLDPRDPTVRQISDVFARSVGR
jgi:hypothetical protein